MNEEITINSMYLLSPMLVNYKKGNDTIEEIVYMDFVGEKILTLSGEALEGKVEEKLIEILIEKKSSALNVQVPQKIISKANQTKNVLLSKGKNVGSY